MTCNITVFGQVIRFYSICHCVGCRDKGINIGLRVWVVIVSDPNCLQTYSCFAKIFPLHVTFIIGLSLFWWDFWFLWQRVWRWLSLGVFAPCNLVNIDPIHIYPSCSVVGFSNLRIYFICLCQKEYGRMIVTWVLEKRWEHVDRINLAQDVGHWWAVMKTVMNFQVS
jgi:hypothetical protein